MLFFLAWRLELGPCIWDLILKAGIRALWLGFVPQDVDLSL